MNKSESIKELATALNKAQAEMPFASMDSVNPFFKSKYADLGSIISTAKPVLAKHGLSISQNVEGADSMVGVTTLMMHTSGEWMESSVFLPVESSKSIAQAAGSTITYLRRYAYAAILGIYADEDTDAEGTKTVTKPASKPTFGKAITLEDTQETLNSKGIKYGDIPVDTLKQMFNALAKKKDPSDDELWKLEACKLLIANSKTLADTAKELGGQSA